MHEQKQQELVICLGSSCFARGNNKTIKVIKKFLEDHGLEDKVFFHGGHCFGQCSEGPIVQVNGTVYKRVDEMNILDILTEHYH